MSNETIKQKYDDWVTRVCSFLEEEGPKLNLPCVSFQSKPILDKHPDVIILGYNPHEPGSFTQNESIRNRFYDGNSAFYKKERINWPIWKPLYESFKWAEYTNPIEDGHFVFFNAIYFGTNNIYEFKKLPGSKDAIRKCIQFTGEVIQTIFKPKCVVCLSVPDCFDNLNRNFKFTDVKRINTLQETDEDIINFAMNKETQRWETRYTCKRKIVKGMWNDIPVYGVPHPSGRLSYADKGAIALYLRSEMQKLNI